ncbi:hypothetical protein [Methylocella sp.]|uniref:hypothetical protein n=1 Tax=Methylocella sp. TaxID=1978226 RepID=UPI003783CF3B
MSRAGGKRDTRAKIAAAALAGLALALAATLSGCDEAPQPARRKLDTQTPGEVPDWLPLGTAIDPAWWLASRRVGAPAPKDDHMIEIYRAFLVQAERQFQEDRRMIANRVDQTAQALAERGEPETYDSILDGFTSLADFSGRKMIFGQICQHYLNLRQRGETRAQALEDLRRAYPHP